MSLNCCDVQITVWTTTFSFSVNLGFLEVSDMNITFGPKVRDEDWIDLIKHYWSILLVVLIAALIIVLMPIIGYVNKSKNMTDNMLSIEVHFPHGQPINICVRWWTTDGAVIYKYYNNNKKFNALFLLFLFCFN